jgi:glycosyltransferase involved in cell wall biosynthesis
MNLPLVMGPMYYPWPKDPASEAKPRFGIGLGALLRPIAEKGWRKSIERASLVFCATAKHAAGVNAEQRRDVAVDLPVIVDPPPEYRRRRVRQPDSTIKLLFVANLHVNKRASVFCETVKSLHDRGIKATGLILGDGPERAGLEAWCQTAGLASAVRFAGRVANNEVYRHMAEADLLVSTSVGEPYGRSIAEAMSVGTPAMCHRSGGPADFIDSGRDGVLIEHLDPDCYAQGICDVCLDPPQRARLSENAYSKAAKWTSEVVLGRLEEALRGVVEASPA